MAGIQFQAGAEFCSLHTHCVRTCFGAHTTSYTTFPSNY